MVKVFSEEGIETEIIHVGNKDIRGCVAMTVERFVGDDIGEDAMYIRK